MWSANRRPKGTPRPNRTFAQVGDLHTGTPASPQAWSSSRSASKAAAPISRHRSTRTGTSRRSPLTTPLNRIAPPFLQRHFCRAASGAHRVAKALADAQSYKRASGRVSRLQVHVRATRSEGHNVLAGASRRPSSVSAVSPPCRSVSRCRERFLHAPPTLCANGYFSSDVCVVPEPPLIGDQCEARIFHLPSSLTNT
jgi:hypothetical protein